MKNYNMYSCKKVHGNVYSILPNTILCFTRRYSFATNEFFKLILHCNVSDTFIMLYFKSNSNFQGLIRML